MRLSVLIALRYLFSKKKHNIINIISAISITGITVGTAALITVLSVFNGFENLVISMFNAINPDLHISVKEGKTFNPDTTAAHQISYVDGVVYITDVVEENVLLNYRERQHVAVIKGVSADFLKMTDIENLVYRGSPVLKEGDVFYALVGSGIAHLMAINPNDYLSPLSVYVPRRGLRTVTDPTQAFNTRYIHPGGLFSVEVEYDEKYFITHIDFAKDLLDYKNELTALEIGIDPSYRVSDVKRDLEKIMGDEFYVKNRFEQQEFLYKIMQSEKWAIFLILTFILIIAVFNVIGTLTMLILEKRRDASVLWTLGATTTMLKRIFFIEGFLISFMGATIGLFLGGLICWLQQTFSLITLHTGDAFMTEAYPVLLQSRDFVLVFFTVITIGLIAAYIPIRKIKIERLEKKA